MVWDKIEDKHRLWLSEHLGLTFEEVDEMTDEEQETLSSDLLSAVADSVMKEVNGDEDDGGEYILIEEILDIIFPPSGEWH